MTILEKFLSGDILALSKIISHVENRGPETDDILAQLYPRTGKAFSIGITGPPGAGKSTIVDKLCALYAKRGMSVGIIAVDPSSPFTGGALLGDRIRMQNLSLLPNVFIRSMASRGSTGGLAFATSEVIKVFDAFGMDIVLVETVGVGQVELDVAEACDITVVVLVPESGDSIQAMKAGLMEIADIFSLNKADRDGANRIVSELNMILDIKRDKMKRDYPVVPTQAINDVGIVELSEKIDKERDDIKQSDSFKKHRTRKIRYDLQKTLEQKLKKRLNEEILTEQRLLEFTEQIYAGNSNPYKIAEEIIKNL